MRTFSLDHLHQKILASQEKIDRKILQKRGEVKEKTRMIRRRPRSVDEQRILDLICKKKWEEALREGKIKKLENRVWYYEFD